MSDQTKLLPQQITEWFPYLAEHRIAFIRMLNTGDTILLTGETGVGKSQLAKLVHGDGDRSKLPCRTINLATLTEEILESELFGHTKGSFTSALADRTGMIEDCDGGTLIIEDVADLPILLQGKLLKFLDDACVRRVGANKEKKVDVRLIFTTNRNLLDEIEEGRFRKDLYYRLANGIHLELPPVRSLARSIVKGILSEMITQQRQMHANIVSGNGPIDFDNEALQAIAFNARGNFRSLQRLAGLLAFEDISQFAAGDLPQEYVYKPNTSSVWQFTEPIQPLADLEMAYIVWVLQQCNGNRTKAADLLGISTRTIRNKFQELRQS